MAHEPKKKHSKAAKRTRRSAIRLASISLQICKNCGAKNFSHMACQSCGFYGGEQKITKQKVEVTKA